MVAQLQIMSSLIPLDEFKSLLPHGHDLNDDQIEILRDLTNAQAEVIFDSFLASKKRQNDENSIKQVI
jgi:hypothetical protein